MPCRFSDDAPWLKTSRSRSCSWVEMLSSPFAFGAEAPSVPSRETLRLLTL